MGGRGLIVAVTLLALLLPSSVAAQNGQKIFELLLNEAERELQRHQRRDLHRQQQREMEQLRQQFLSLWNACHRNDLDACDQALSIPQLSAQDRQVLLQKRADILARQDATARSERDRLEAELAELRRLRERDEAALRERALEVARREQNTASISWVFASLVGAAVAAMGLVGLHLARNSAWMQTIAVRKWTLTAWASLAAMAQRITPARDPVTVSEREPPSLDTPSLTLAQDVPRDPVSARSALELAHAYLDGVRSNLSNAVGDPAVRARCLNDLALAGKQLALAESADPTAIFTIEDERSGAHDFSLSSPKAQALFCEGVCHSAADPKRAIPMFEQAVALEPSAAEAHYWLGLVHAGLFNKTKAIAAFERATALDPKNLEYRMELGRARNISGAEIAFDRAATGARLTKKTLKWIAIGSICIMLVSCVASLADPRTRGETAFGIFAVLIALGMLVGMVQTVWKSITGRN